MSEREPITAELRDAMGTDHIFCDVGGLTIARNLTITQAEFDCLCDAIDAVHAGLERENAELRQRVEELGNGGGSMHDGGSITDEMREWASVEVPYKYGHQLTAIANRIDAEHGRQLNVLYRDMSDAEWIRLPLDADGVPIRVGDVMDSKVDYLFDGRPFVVRALVLCEDGWEVADGRFGNRYEPDSLRHHHAPTVEDVLREMADRCYADEDEPRDRDAIIAEYAVKLRLAGDAE